MAERADNPVLTDEPAPPPAEPGLGRATRPIQPGQAPVEQLRPDFEGMEKRAFEEIDNDNVLRGVMRNISRARTQWTQATQTDREKTKADVINTTDQLARGDDVPLIPEAHIRHLFDQATSDDMVEKQRDAQLIGNALNSIQGKSLKEINDDMTALAQGRGFPGIHDFALRERGRVAYGVAASHWISTIVGTKDTPGDPAAAFAQTPGLKDQATALAAMPPPAKPEDMPAYTAAHESYAQAQIGRQSGFGLSPEQTHVLSADQAQGYAAALYKDPANARDELNSLAKAWGAAWPQVWKDITHFGKLPASYQAIGILDDHNAMRLAQGLSDERGGEPGEKKGLEVWEATFGHEKTHGSDGVINAVRDRMQEFLKSMPSASQPQKDSLLHSVDTLAFSLMSRENLDVATAVDKAVHAFNDLYEFMPQGGARVPKAQYNAVNTSAQATVDRLTTSNIMLPRGIGDYPGAPTAEDYVANIKANPIWINGHDGIELIDPRFARRVLNQEGYPITIPFNVRPPPVAAPTPVPDLNTGMMSQP